MQKINKYKEFKVRTEEELKFQCDSIWNFLKETHKLLNLKNKVEISAEYADSLALEIRALRRDKSIPVYCNFRLFKFTNSEKERLLKFLKILNKKTIPYCLYYSVFVFNNNELAISQNNNKAEEWNNRIALNNSVATQILVADFDDITEEDFLKQKQKLLSVGIETFDIFSGHGYQSIILLNKFTKDTDILRKFTNLMISKGFKVDKKIKDSARIMRLPFSTNSKELSKRNIENPFLIDTFIYNRSSERYDVKEVFDKLNKLETVVFIEEDYKEKFNGRKNNEDMNALKNKYKLKDVKTSCTLIKDRLSDEDLENIYMNLNIKELEESIKLMLSGFQNGYANNILMFIVLYLKEKGYSKSLIVEVIDILKNLDTFNYKWEELNTKYEVDRFYYNKEYTSKSVFFSELKDFGYIEYNFEDKSVITINNYLFSRLSDISSSAFYIYIKLIEKKNYDNKSVFTINEIAEISELSRRSVIKHIDDLVKVKIIDKKRAKKKKGEEYKFFISKFEHDKELGFTKFNISTIKLLLTYVKMKEINNTQLIICMYIKHICYNKKSNCNISQQSLANEVGITQSAVSKSFLKIERLQLIKREKEDINDFQFKYNYTIHF